MNKKYTREYTRERGFVFYQPVLLDVVKIHTKCIVMIAKKWLKNCNIFINISVN